MAAPGPCPVVAVIGGGYSGAAFAWHLAAMLPARAAEIVVIEPRAELGRGLAYSATDPSHRINVPAAKMGLATSDITDFARWLADRPERRTDPQIEASNGDLFPQRGLFGSYVAERLAPLLADGRVRHVRATVTGAVRRGEGFALSTDDGLAVAADIVVVAATHPPPALPAALRDLVEDSRVIADPFDTDRLARIPQDAPVLILGAGLTSADVIASLDRVGHRGVIHVFSRHGLRSQNHAPAPQQTGGDFATAPSVTALGLLGRIRNAIRQDARNGLTWHAAIDLVRTQGGAIWQALPQPEQARLLRHLRSYWDVYRFRIAPQVDQVIRDRQAAGTLSYRAARLSSVGAGADGLAISLRTRGGGEEGLAVAAIVVTTGPAHAAAHQSNPALRALHEIGALEPDALGLGLHVDGEARAVAGAATERNLYICSPLARGRFGELMGVPEVTAHAERVAQSVATRLATSRGEYAA